MLNLLNEGVPLCTYMAYILRISVILNFITKWHAYFYLRTYIRTYTYASRHFECVIFDWLGLKTGGANPGHVKIHTL